MKNIPRERDSLRPYYNKHIKFEGILEEVRFKDGCSGQFLVTNLRLQGSKEILADHVWIHPSEKWDRHYLSSMLFKEIKNIFETDDIENRKIIFDRRDSYAAGKRKIKRKLNRLGIPKYVDEHMIRFSSKVKLYDNGRKFGLTEFDNEEIELVNIGKIKFGYDNDFKLFIDFIKLNEEK